MRADLDQLVVDCRAALTEREPKSAMREVLTRAVSDATGLGEALPADQQQMVVVHLSDDLSILQIVNEPGFVFHPHDHGSWSACAFYAGRERNTFYRRTAHGLEKSNGKEYGEGDVAIMGSSVVHSIENPLRTNNAALHVFAGNPFTAECSQWDMATLEKAPFDAEYAMAVYPSPSV